MIVCIERTGWRAEGARRREGDGAVGFAPAEEWSAGTPGAESGGEGAPPAGGSRVEVRGGTITVTADPFGFHSLYVLPPGAAGDPLVVATDPRDLAAFRGAEVDREALRLVPLVKFLPPPLSPVRGAVRVPAGCAWVYRGEPPRRVEERCLLGELVDAPRVERAIVPRVRSALADAVARAARPGETAHVFLSGGLDSALLVHLLQRAGARVRAWSAVFDTPGGRKEGERARRSASWFGVPWTEVRVGKSSVLEQLPRILSEVGEPFADVALLAEAALALGLREREQAPDVGVFEGEGMDSLFCGSYKFVVERYRRWARPAARILGAALASPLGKAVGGAGRRHRWEQVRTLLAGGAALERHLRFLGAELGPEDAPEGMAGAVREAFARLYALPGRADELNRLAAMTFFGNLPYLENRKLATIARAAGVGFRLPYQDPEVVRLAFAVPGRAKVRRGYGKAPVRRAFRRALPPHLRSRRKASFVPPVLEWLLPEHRDVLLEGSVWPAQDVEKRLAAYRRGERSPLAFLWGVFVVHHWVRQFEERAAAARAETASAARTDRGYWAMRSITR